MSNGPWSGQPSNPPPPPRPARGGGRLLLWLAIVTALLAGVFALAKAFPELALQPQDWGQVAYLLGFLLLLSAGVARVTRASFVQHLRYAAVWAGVVAVLALGYAYRDELAQVPQRLQMAFGAGDPVAAGDHQLAIERDDREGGFLVVGQVNGQRVRFLIDTGATDTVLSPDDARRLGVPLDSLAYDHLTETANGTGRAADWTADRLEVGAIRLDNFPMTVNQAPMSTSLLGMSFLSRLESFEVRGRRLILRWRD